MNIKIRQELEKDYKRAEEVVKQAFLNEAFMAMELTDHDLRDIQGVVRYSEAFSE
ncbi:GNAT family acetyltransferase [Bacillus pseudomycoides]|uniref:GNAT family acetyltransferase n=1 Tax=Bacillus pseudomycoides TaxID=64104 RepID=A0AA91ZS35_9BACI|nr:MULTISPECIES: GNAT family acetyltransferase [Bacillus]PEB47486.1 GNAT family acetyltransferase [Bacillus sp. AFS098217]PED81069.1 GNAT family acetyltransferase [Bacillus pseudomycoides]PEU16703.1 GNAT family acetyltransferase [Bacillus sp. AFS019443]PEU21577.1 GNAT family acetyltransferase [Bacillus sp. AFS014408]PFW57954.1 GNAT family acetyltransferase [Bacillus sp. AFS075034]